MSASADGLVLLVRHPETLANTERRYVGTSESPYSTRGMGQADTLALALSAWSPDRIFCSPRMRARDLAERVSGGGAPIVLDDIAEIDFGCAEHMTADEMAAAGLRVDYPGMPAIEGRTLCGESWESFRTRTARAAGLFSLEQGRTLVVTHGGVIRALMAAWFELSARTMYRLEVRNAGYTLVAFRDGEAYLRSFGPDVRQIVPADG